MKKGKTYGTKVFPPDTLETSDLFGRVEALITADELRSRFLHSVPSLDNFSDAELKREIESAMNQIELETGISLYKTQKRQRMPYDAALYRSFLYMKMNHRPILSVEKVAVISSDGQGIYNVPLEWLEASFFHKGQINLLPIMSVFGIGGVKASDSASGNLIFLQALANYNWLPAFWTVEYTVGISHTDGHMPVVMNDLIGITAALNVLSALQTTNIYTSQSLSQDGISQSSSGPGPQIFQPRIDFLTGRRQLIMGQIKRITFNKYFLTNI